MNTSNHEVLSAAHPADWAKAEHLLPGYLKKNLSASDQEWMKQWIYQIQNTGGATAEALAAEITWVELAQDVLGEQSAAFNAQAGWQKLQAGLKNEAASGATVSQSAEPTQAVTSFQKLRQWMGKLARMQQDRALQWWQKPATGVLASAMIVGQMGLLAAAVKQVYVMTTDTATVTPSSGSNTPVDGAVLKVIFKPNSSVKDILGVLNSVQGRVTGGPGALGIWEVEVPTDKLPSALEMLGKSKTVESVTQQ